MRKKKRKKKAVKRKVKKKPVKRKAEKTFPPKKLEGAVKRLRIEKLKEASVHARKLIAICRRVPEAQLVVLSQVLYADVYLDVTIERMKKGLGVAA